jgi:ribonuclease HII
MLVAGVDEAGRGPLAGPVVVAAVILDPGQPVCGLDDSKRLSQRKREELFPLITGSALAWSIQIVSATEIDEHNILQATMIGMQRSIIALDPKPTLALIDGNRAPEAPCPTQTIIQGDRLKPEISAASILAKVTRDKIMCDLHLQYPSYGFDRHKGYPTAQHLSILKSIGPCPEHRQSFAPVRNSALKKLI